MPVTSDLTSSVMLSRHHDKFSPVLIPLSFLKQVRASGFGGWFLLRLSLHDPVLPLNIEVENILSFSASTATVISLYIATKSNCASGN